MTWRDKWLQHRLLFALREHYWGYQRSAWKRALIIIEDMKESEGHDEIEEEVEADEPPYQGGYTPEEGRRNRGGKYGSLR